MDEKIYKVCFAARLFNHKDLINDAVLASAINKESNGRYEIIVADTYGDLTAATEIRDRDFEKLLESDVVLVSIGNTGLDVASMSEFCFAKILDIPAVILEYESRSNNDQASAIATSHLLCSNYPRTETVLVNTFELYHKYCNSTGASMDDVNNYYTDVAKRVIAAMDKVVQEPSWLKAESLETVEEITAADDMEDMEILADVDLEKFESEHLIEINIINSYLSVLKSIGGKMEEIFPYMRLKEVVAEKIAKGIY